MGRDRVCQVVVLSAYELSSGEGGRAVAPRRTRVIDCSAEALYDSTLDVLLWGLDARGC